MAMPIRRGLSVGFLIRLGGTSQSPQKIDAIRTTGGPFREAKDSRSKQTRERLDACRETSDVCVCPEKGAGQT